MQEKKKSWHPERKLKVRNRKKKTVLTVRTITGRIGRGEGIRETSKRLNRRRTFQSKQADIATAGCSK